MQSLINTSITRQYGGIGNEFKYVDNLGSRNRGKPVLVTKETAEHEEISGVRLRFFEIHQAYNCPVLEGRLNSHQNAIKICINLRIMSL